MNSRYNLKFLKMVSFHPCVHVLIVGMLYSQGSSQLCEVGVLVTPLTCEL